jgi:glucan biosynthesis protein C
MERSGHAPRRADIDLLRVAATLLLFWFHTNKMFDVSPFYHVKNDVGVPALEVATYAVHFWHMPLFFALAGWSAFHSLAQRGRRRYTEERKQRLLLPLLAALLWMMPILKYFEMRSGFSLGVTGYRVLETLWEGGFFAFLPYYFTHPLEWTWSHMWFLAYLFTFSLLYRPLMLHWIEDGERWAPGRRSAGVWTPLLLLCLIQTTLRLVWPGGLNLVNDWANFAFYSTFFLAGFLLARHPGWQQALDRERWSAVAIALAANVAMYGYWLATDGQPWPDDPSLAAVLALLPVLALTAVAAYATVVALLAFAHRWAARRGRLLAYLAEASMPLYVLHQLVLTVCGFYLLRSDLPLPTKYLCILAMGLAVTLAVYHSLVRPNPYLRPLFGLSRTLRHQPAPGWQLAAGGAVGTLIALAVFGAGPSMAASGERSPLGLWYAEAGAATVEIRRCGAELCGFIADLKHPFDERGCLARDEHNPEPRLRSRTITGTQILGRLAPEDDGAWSGGWVYDPDSGRTYSASLQLTAPDRLDLRGYWGVSLLGRTSTWWRVGSEDRRCPLPEPDS